MRHEVSDNEREARSDAMNVLRGITRKRKTRQWMLAQVYTHWGTSVDPVDYIGWMRGQLKRDLYGRMIFRQMWMHHLIAVRPDGWFASQADRNRGF